MPRSPVSEMNLSDTGSWGDFSFSLSENPSVTRFAIDLVFTLSSLSHFAFQFASLLFVFLNNEGLKLNGRASTDFA